jgi:hypothetical protein
MKLKIHRGVMITGILTSLGGCDADGPTISLSEPQTESQGGLGVAKPFHDFGTRLATGQTLSHVFTLSNPSRAPIQLISAEPLTPCCSTIGRFAGAIPSGGTVELPVTLTLGQSSERKTVSFLVRTDRPESSTVTLSVGVNAVAAHEAIRGESALLRLLAGKSRAILFQIVARRQGDEGLSFPTLVEPTAPITAAFTGPRREVVTKEGVLEVSQTLNVMIPALNEPGSHVAQLAFRFPEGSSRTLDVRWEVKAAFEVVPPVSLIENDLKNVEQVVTVVSHDGPFQLLEIEAPRFVKGEILTRGSHERHRVRLSFDPSQIETEGTEPRRVAHARIVTDHPASGNLRWSAMLLKPERRGP